jgi:hypothetical protein
MMMIIIRIIKEKEKKKTVIIKTKKKIISTSRFKTNLDDATTVVVITWNDFGGGSLADKTRQDEAKRNIHAALSVNEGSKIRFGFYTKTGTNV